MALQRRPPIGMADVKAFVTGQLTVVPPFQLPSSKQCIRLAES